MVNIKSPHPHHVSNPRPNALLKFYDGPARTAQVFWSFAAHCVCSHQNCTTISNPYIYISVNIVRVDIDDYWPYETMFIQYIKYKKKKKRQSTNKFRSIFLDSSDTKTNFCNWISIIFLFLSQVNVINYRLIIKYAS